MAPHEDGAALRDDILSDMRFAARLSSTAQIASTSPRVFRGTLERDEQSGQAVVSFAVPDYLVPGNRFRYQLGFTPSRDSRYYYGTWRNGSAASNASSK